MSLLDDIAAIDEDALVMWDKAQIELPEGIRLAVNNFMVYMPGVREALFETKSVSTLGRYLAVWVPYAKRWITRRVFDWKEVAEEKHSLFSPIVVESYDEFMKRIVEAWLTSQPS